MARMTTDIAPEQTDFRKVISDRIKNEFATLIPDDRWEQLVTRTIDEFVTEREVGPNYNRRKEPSEFSVIVTNVMRELVAEKCKEHIARWIADKGVEKVTQQIENSWQQVLREVAQAWIANLVKTISDESCNSALGMVHIPVRCPQCREFTNKPAGQYSVDCSSCGTNIY